MIVNVKVSYFRNMEIIPLIIKAMIAPGNPTITNNQWHGVGSKRNNPSSAPSPTNHTTEKLPTFAISTKIPKIIPTIILIASIYITHH